MQVIGEVVGINRWIKDWTGNSTTPQFEVRSRVEFPSDQFRMDKIGPITMQSFEIVGEYALGTKFRLTIEEIPPV